MAGKKNDNGEGTPHVLNLTRKRFRRSSLEAFSEDFIEVCEVAADDVVNSRLSPAVHNSMRGAYSNMLHMMDIQMRAKKAGVTSKGLLKS